MDPSHHGQRNIADDITALPVRDLFSCVLHGFFLRFCSTQKGSLPGCRHSLHQSVLINNIFHVVFQLVYGVIREPALQQDIRDGEP